MRTRASGRGSAACRNRSQNRVSGSSRSKSKRPCHFAWVKLTITLSKRKLGDKHPTLPRHSSAVCENRHSNSPTFDYRSSNWTEHREEHCRHQPWMLHNQFISPKSRRRQTYTKCSFHQMLRATRRSRTILTKRFTASQDTGYIVDSKAPLHMMVLSSLSPNGRTQQSKQT